jgi:hypothetical protein
MKEERERSMLQAAGKAGPRSETRKDVLKSKDGQWSM